jgi:hypothetical protein
MIWPILNATADQLYEFDLTEIDRETMLLGEPTDALSETAEAMLEAGRLYKGAECADSPIHPLLQSLAVNHATYMARHCQGGHQRFNQRLHAIIKQFGYSVRSSEIAARSWRRQANDPLPEVGREMWKSWEGSDVHWPVASRRHDAIGLDMARGRDGIWYGTVLVIDGIDTKEKV